MVSTGRKCVQSFRTANTCALAIVSVNGGCRTRLLQEVGMTAVLDQVLYRDQCWEGCQH